MNQKKKRYGRGFMEDSLCILIAVCLIIVVAFIWNYVIIRKEYNEESVRQRQDLFAEVVLQTQEAEETIERILMSAVSQSAVVTYAQAEPLAERWDQLEQIQQFATNLTTLNDSIVAVCVYDADNNIIAMQGSRYTPLPEGKWEEEYKFSNKVTVGADRKIYFYGAVPVYQENRNGSYSRVGGLALLLQNTQLQKIMDFAASGYSEEEIYFAVTDRNGEVLAQAGNDAIYEAYQQCEKKEESYLYLEDTMKLSRWKLLFVTHRASYMNYMDFVQNVNLFTYAGVLAALILFCYMMYARVIVPLKKQMDFVTNYTKDMSQRMDTSGKYEFGALEKELNEMLDGIEELNRQILEEQERYQKLEYEKKQTEIIAYKNQINPHFMHNTLECIRGMALYKGEREIAKLTEAMSRMFQYNIRGSEIVSVKEMVRAIQDYAVIIEYRFMGKIAVKVQMDPRTESGMLPKMLIQPLVENAVRHGVEHQIEGGEVVLEIADRGTWLEIVIRDTGVGMDAQMCEQLRKRFTQTQEMAPPEVPVRQIGISNVARRLYLFYQDAYEVVLESTVGEGTAITLHLPKEFSQ